MENKFFEIEEMLYDESVNQTRCNCKIFCKSFHIKCHYLKDLDH